MFHGLPSFLVWFIPDQPAPNLKPAAKETGDLRSSPVGQGSGCRRTHPRSWHDPCLMQANPLISISNVNRV